MGLDFSRLWGATRSTQPSLVREKWPKSLWGTTPYTSVIRRYQVYVYETIKGNQVIRNVLDWPSVGHLFVNQITLYQPSYSVPFCVFISEPFDRPNKCYKLLTSVIPNKHYLKWPKIGHCVNQRSNQKLVISSTKEVTKSWSLRQLKKWPNKWPKVGNSVNQLSDQKLLIPLTN